MLSRNLIPVDLHITKHNGTTHSKTTISHQSHLFQYLTSNPESTEIVPCIMTPHNLVGGYCSGGTYYLHFRWPAEDSDSVFPEALITIYQTAWCPQPDHITNIHHCENMK